MSILVLTQKRKASRLKKIGQEKHKLDRSKKADSEKILKLWPRQQLRDGL